MISSRALFVGPNYRCSNDWLAYSSYHTVLFICKQPTNQIIYPEDCVLPLQFHREENTPLQMELHTAKEDFLNMHVTKVVKNKTISRDRRRVNKTAYCDYVEPTTHTFQRRQATHPPTLRTLCRMAPNYYFVHSKFSNFSARTEPPTQQLCRYFTPLLVYTSTSLAMYIYIYVVLQAIKCASVEIRWIMNQKSTESNFTSK